MAAAVIPVVAVIVPTIDGREAHYDRCARSYIGCSYGSYTLRWIAERNRPTCGWGWQHGADRLPDDAEFVHFTCDDIEALPGWAEAGIGALQRGVLPAPNIHNGHTGKPESFPYWGTEWPEGTFAGLCALPFLTRELWDKHVAPMMTAHYFCTAPETPVLTAAMDWVPAGKLTPGDELVSVDEFAPWAAGRRFRRATVMANGLQARECVTVMTEDGRQVTCSGDHPWLVRTQGRAAIGQGNTLNWVSAARLRPGDQIVAPFRPWQPETSFEMGWLAGMFDGEGSAGRYQSTTRPYASTSLTIAQNPGPTLERIRAALDSMGIRYSVQRNASASQVTKLQVRGVTAAMELVGRLHPTRLQPDGLWEGAAIRTKQPGQYATVAEIAPAGRREVATLGTSTGTFIAAGLVSHNTDNWCTYRAGMAGFPPLVTRGYAFRHWWATERRGAGMEYNARLRHDQALFTEAVGMAERGEWTVPWPPEEDSP